MRLPRLRIPHFSIRFALMAVIAVLTVCLLTLGGVSVFEIRTLSAQNSALNNERIPSMKALGDIKTAAIRMRLRAAQFTSSTDPQQMESYAGQVDRSVEELARLFETYDGLVSSEQESTTWKTFKSSWAVYVGRQTKAIDAKKAGKNDVAATLFGGADKIFATSLSALDQNILLNKRIGEDSTAAARTTADEATIAVAVIGCGSLALAVLSGLFVVFRVSRPIRAVTTAMQNVSKGDLATEIPSTESRNELGDMARTLVVFRDGLAETESLRRQQAEREAEQAARLEAERHQIADRFMATMGGLAQSFVKSSGEVAEAARNLSATAEETAQQAQSVAHAAEEASTNVQTVAASTEELAASVREINGQVVHSSTIAGTAAEEAASTEANIRQLSEAAEKIGDVVNLIRDIAGQTNLLALNATIEAARAGEAGKGFAVVASEVKLLAAQTAKATDEIAQKVGEIQAATDDTVQSISRIVGTIGSIREVTSSIAGAVTEQGAATDEISSNTHRAAQGAGQVTDNISGVGRAAEMTGAAATQLLGLSDALSSQADRLTREVDDFVHTLRSA